MRIPNGAFSYLGDCACVPNFHNQLYYSVHVFCVCCNTNSCICGIQYLQVRFSLVLHIFFLCIFIEQKSGVAGTGNRKRRIRLTWVHFFLCVQKQQRGSGEKVLLGNYHSKSLHCSGLVIFTACRVSIIVTETWTPNCSSSFVASLLHPVLSVRLILRFATNDNLV